MIGGDGTSEMILLPGGLRVRNSASSTVSYEVQLPLTISTVEVVVAGASELLLDVSAMEPPLRRELDLSVGAGR